MLTRAPEGLPPIVQTAERLLVSIEDAVRGLGASLSWLARCAQPSVAQIRSRRICPRYHKYTLGADLRRQTMTTVRLVHRAWRDKAQVDEHLQRLIWAVDELKLSLHLGRQITAFASSAQFEACAELAVQLGKQCGGWQRHRTGNGQNPGGSSPRRARPDVLSTHAARESAHEAVP